jgi:hypothetical protein
VGLSGETKTALKGKKVNVRANIPSWMGCGWLICTHIHGTVKANIDWKLDALRNVALGCSNWYHLGSLRTYIRFYERRAAMFKPLLLNPPLLFTPFSDENPNWQL